MMQAGGFSATIEREKARTRTRDALLSKARAGHVCDRDGRRVELERVLQAQGETTTRRVDRKALERRLRTKLANWRRLLRGEVTEGRDVLRWMLVSK